MLNVARSHIHPMIHDTKKSRRKEKGGWLKTIEQKRRGEDKQLWVDFINKRG